MQKILIFMILEKVVMDNYVMILLIFLIFYKDKMLFKHYKLKEDNMHYVMIQLALD